MNRRCRGEVSCFPDAPRAGETVRYAGRRERPKDVMERRARLGLDKPLYVQFFKWFGALLTGDFGVSIWTGRPVLYEIGIRLELSLQVAVMATILAVLIAIPLGTLSAIYKDTWIDHLVRVFSIAGLAVPSFWLGMIIILLLLTYFSWIPPLTFTPFFEDPLKNLSQLIWPARGGFRYSSVAMRRCARPARGAAEDYVRTRAPKASTSGSSSRPRHAQRPLPG